MSTKIELGKILKVDFGFYDGRFGFTYELTAGGWSVVDFQGMWSDVPKNTYKWTVADQDEAFVKAWRKTMEIMAQAKVQELKQLVGKPIEVTTEGMILKSWRILTEVI